MTLPRDLFAKRTGETGGDEVPNRGPVQRTAKMTTGNAGPGGSVLITVDVEDWFQVENLRPAYPLERWDSCDLRVESSTKSLLDLLDRHGAKATFFVLGWVAERCGRLVTEIHKRGHEIASHGWSHQLCFGLTTQELREDLLRSKSILEDLTGQAVWGYRAPSFSITDGVVETMGELGYRYDASHNSFSIDKRHGQPNGLRVDSGREWAFANGILELPVSNLVIRGQSVPWGGGGYFRFWPSRLFHWGVKRILRTDGRYVFYCHPWEIDAGQPRVKEVGFLHRYRHYKNIGGTLKRLDHFLTEFRHHGLVSCRDYLGDRVRGVDWSDPLSRARKGSCKQ